MAAAGIAVSVTMGVMKPVLQKLTTLMGNEYKKITGLRKEVSFLRDELRAMDHLLEMMDAADRLDSQAKGWRKDIIDMSYDIEDCIDDFMQSVGEDRHKVGILQKASSFLRTIKDRYRIAKQINKIKTRVIQTSQRRERYKLDLSNFTPTPVVVDPRLSALYKDSATLVGLENQKEELTRWIMDEERKLKVMSIVGFGGLGKTTLANEVYRQVGGRFTCKALICVSQKPDILKLLKRILLGVGEEQYSQMACCAEQDLLSALKKHLLNKSYFIIIDDLWESEVWDVIGCAFPQNDAHCCKVMITTRDKEVASRCCGNVEFIYNMKPLSEPDSSKLFLTIIFGSPDNCPSGFEEFSRAILKRCGGLPLAIITIAGILASKHIKQPKETWEYIQNALASEMETNIDYEKMMYILDLSYKTLPCHLKACFLYLGTYPEDHNINKLELLRRWVAEGFVSNPAGLNVWDVAESYFNELVNRSMIQPSSFEHQNVILSCRVHDMMLDLILRKCKEDNFLILVNDPHEVAAGQDKVIRRLTMDLKCVDDGRLAMANNQSGNLSHLRSLTILFREGSKWKPPLLESKFVRVLLLSFGSMTSMIEMDIFGIINQLRLLRYLKVEGGQVLNETLLTTQIKGLRHLETLDISRLHVQRDCRRFVLDFVDLPQLSHLSVDATSGIALPRGIGEMTQLRTLRGLDLDHSSSQSIIDLGKLTALSDLYLVFAGRCKHGVDWGVWKPEWMPSLSASLSLRNLGNLRSVDVTTSDAPVAHCADEKRLLFPSSGGSLEQLHLWFWTFSSVPEWIGHLRSLKVLRLGVKQIIQEDIDVLGSLPSLVDLKLRIVHVPTTRIVIGEKLFEAVKWFTFNCDEISSLTFEAGAMPNLGELTLVFNTADWNRKHTPTPVGLEHLLGLQKISLYRRGEKEADGGVIMDVFKVIVNKHPTRPVFIYHGAGMSSNRVEKEFDPLESS